MASAANMTVTAVSWWCGDGGALNISAVAPLLTAFALILAVALYRKSNPRGGREPPLPPGPRGLPVVGSLPFLNPDLHLFFSDLSRAYGPIVSVRLGQKLVVVVSSAALAKEVLKDHDAVFANRDVLAAALELPNGRHGMGWAPYGPQWRMLRRLTMADMLNQAGVDAFRGLRREEVRRLVGRLVGEAGRPVNVGEAVFGPVYSVLTGVLWGGDRREEVLEVVEDVSEMFGKADVSDVFPVLARLGVKGVIGKARKVAGILDRTWDNILRERMDGGRGGVAEGRRDLLQLLLETMEKRDPKTPVTPEHVKGILTDLVLAGLFTTSTTMEWAMTEMLQHPSTMKKVQEELDRVVGRDSLVEESHLPKLSYLSALIKEVLRLHPTTPLMLPRTPSQTAVIGGYKVPHGCCVLVNIWAIERDAAAWDRPTEFEPERFLRAPAAKWDYSGNDLHYFPYGSGRRICPGMHLADRMLMHVLASLLQCFEWRLPEGRPLDVSAKLGAVLKKAAPLVAVPAVRLHNAELFESLKREVQGEMVTKC